MDGNRHLISLESTRPMSKSPFKDSLKALEADIQHANALYTSLSLSLSHPSCVYVCARVCVSEILAEAFIMSHQLRLMLKCVCGSAPVILPPSLTHRPSDLLYKAC